MMVTARKAQRSATVRWAARETRVFISGSVREVMYSRTSESVSRFRADVSIKKRR